MSVSQAEIWAGNLTVEGMDRKIREMEIWVVELNRRVVGWGAIRGDRLEGLYMDPDLSGQGIGTALLTRLEGLMRERDMVAIRTEATLNAEDFYLRRGYQPAGPRLATEIRPLAKRLT